jgi:hypothetical protein
MNTIGSARRPASDYWLHDPRVDPPTKRDRRRLLMWVAFLGITPICLGVVVWAAFGLNGGYPTVAPPVPAGWQAVRGIYASFSAPKNWALQQGMSDAAGDIYYAGPTGGAGESVLQSDKPPSTARFPTIVRTYLGGNYSVLQRAPYRVRNATFAWEYTFRLSDRTTGIGILAWVKQTQSEVWLIVTPADRVTEKVMTTLALAS